jgi:hypothetical protein
MDKGKNKEIRTQQQNDRIPNGSPGRSTKKLQWTDEKMDAWTRCWEQPNRKWKKIGHSTEKLKEAEAKEAGGGRLAQKKGYRLYYVNVNAPATGT